MSKLLLYILVFIVSASISFAQDTPEEELEKAIAYLSELGQLSEDVNNNVTLHYDFRRVEPIYYSDTNYRNADSNSIDLDVYVFYAFEGDLLHINGIGALDMPNMILTIRDTNSLEILKRKQANMTIGELINMDMQWLVPKTGTYFITFYGKVAFGGLGTQYDYALTLNLLSSENTIPVTSTPKPVIVETNIVDEIQAVLYKEVEQTISNCNNAEFTHEEIYQSSYELSSSLGFSKLYSISSGSEFTAGLELGFDLSISPVLEFEYAEDIHKEVSTEYQIETTITLITGREIKMLAPPRKRVTYSPRWVANIVLGEIILSDGEVQPFQWIRSMRLDGSDPVVEDC